MPIYTTKSGDTWDQIARSQLGEQLLVSVLMDSNPDYIETLIFQAGVQLIIPNAVTQTISKNLPPWKRGDG
ncbi:tail protein X [Paenibacillus naphthalenovorans]|uniref:tail protein X n=1 Tax=Paenibacillus naphthalenovorans TaxID=162209 RepID=UPI003D29F3BA